MHHGCEIPYVRFVPCAGYTRFTVRITRILHKSSALLSKEHECCKPLKQPERPHTMAGEGAVNEGGRQRWESGDELAAHVGVGGRIPDPGIGMRRRAHDHKRGTSNKQKQEAAHYHHQPQQPCQPLQTILERERTTALPAASARVSSRSVGGCGGTCGGVQASVAQRACRCTALRCREKPTIDALDVEIMAAP